MFRYGEHAFGIEFHPEMTLAMIERWSGSDRGGAMLTLPGGQPREAHLDGHRLYSRTTDRWLARFLDEHFLPAQAPLAD
jgi:GMP synthase (glutamine-hydrolysing)